MSSPSPSARPGSVTIVAVLTGLLALTDIVSGLVVVLGAPSADLIEGLTREQTTLALRVIGGWFIVLGVAHAVIAWLIARRSTAARLALSVLLVLRLAQAWFLVSQLGTQALQGFWGLALAVLLVYLLCNSEASRWFDGGTSRNLADSLDDDPGTSAPSGARVLDFISRLAVLGATIALMPGVAASSSLSLLAAVVMIALVGWVLQPVFLRIALVFGWFGAVLLALFANALVIGLGLYLTPGITISSPISAFFAAWVYAFVITLLTWAFSINGRDYLTVHAVRMASRGTRPEPSDVPGVIFIQLDGVPAPLLENEIRAGNIPTISRWVRSGSHTWTEWTARAPSTTPVSQAGLLHGHNDGIPAFRWFDRDLGRLLVANRPADAAVIEARISDGRGLLADDGVSISNLFSGDAPTSLLTMSGLKQGSAGLGPSQSYAAFFTHPRRHPARRHPHDRRDGQGGIPGPPPGAPGRRAAHPPGWCVRRPARGDQRVPA